MGLELTVARVTLVTGGGGGMGRAIAARFMAGGDTVVISDRTQEVLDDAASDLPGVGTVVADVTSVADCERMIAETLAAHGRLDVLVITAGVWVEGDSAAMTEAQWDHVLDVNLKGAFFACRFAIPALQETGGSIVCISSDYGLVGGPGAALYCASKFGLNGLVKSLALELAPSGVRVNSVCPTDVDTPMLQGQATAYGGEDPQRYLRTLLDTVPQGDRARFIRADEIAAAVAFLASSEAEPITGVCLPVDWGVTAGY
jgi:Dehydrogenases with different specificities (related to short-chain alcohol dehydrogenases)